MSRIEDALLLALALLAGGWDACTRRIPNWLTLPAALAGLAWHGSRDGWRGVAFAFGGWALGLLVLLPFFAAGGMGAGDVKLMGAVGALAGPQGLVVIFIYTGLFGGVAAVVLALARGRLGATLRNTVRLVSLLGRGQVSEASKLETAAGRLPYGAVIAAGCLLFLWIGPRSIL
jgi:prepilin peptidase CpaA